jgi:hypothetical protein
MTLQTEALIETQTGNGPPKRTEVTVEPNDIRLILAIIFSFLFALTIAMSIAFTFWPGVDSTKTWNTMKDVLGVLLPAETGLLGTILGFYFGSKSSEAKQTLSDS